ncbi:MAG: tRNA uridine-5-carboxymethylaminomethyl(34) synthesis GTPase MnmE [Alcanivoracaceae bacterium]|nr:tRNA uridine-5-carboxymethylaminomethyl(34) synthesis GTPase MnmE [Alcanivoracaceae bacterium]
MNDQQDTIVAVATAPGRGGIGVVRLSGRDAKKIAARLTPGVPEPQPRHAHFARFVDGDEVIDEGLLLYFPGPNSFTGEEVIELQGHGGPVLLDRLVRTCIRHGARQARPGEFSLRAFLNDRMDLTQAEAIADLIDAGTESAARAAVNSLQGAFSQAVNDLVEGLIQLRMYVEAAIDFPEEEIDFLADSTVAADLAALMKKVAEVMDRAQQGRLLREGFNIVIAGRPNAGKSSLLNALAGTDAAIVTDIPGTTRDVLRETIQLDGLPLNIIDTAGLRESPDVVEQEGIRRAWAEMEKADLLLVVADASQPAEASLEQLLPGNVQQLTKLRAHQLLVLNKLDLCSTPPQAPAQLDTIAVSAKTGAGMDTLRAKLKDLAGYHQVSGTGTFSARRRHLDALRQAEAALQRGHDQLQQHQAGELLAEDLRAAQQALEEITGAFSSDDLLGRIFSSFCIGK